MHLQSMIGPKVITVRRHAEVIMLTTNDSLCISLRDKENRKNAVPHVKPWQSNPLLSLGDIFAFYATLKTYFMLILGFCLDTMTHDQTMAKTNKHVGSSGTSLIKMAYVEKMSITEEL